MNLFDTTIPRFQEPAWRIYARECCRLASIGMLCYFSYKLLEFMAT